MLLPDYYTILSRTTKENLEVFEVALLPDCKVYRGHFPEKAVSPGVCNIELLKECAEQVAGKELLLQEIKSCRLTTLVTPQTHPFVEARIALSKDGEQYMLNASLGKGEDSYLTLKGTLVDPQKF